MKKGELRHIRIEPADDGSAVLHVHKKQNSAKAQKGPWLSDESEEIHTHPTPEEAGKHVTAILRQHFAKESPKAADSAAKRRDMNSAKGTGTEKAFPSDDGQDAELG